RLRVGPVRVHRLRHHHQRMVRRDGVQDAQGRHLQARHQDGIDAHREDPFALRRATLGIIRIVLENDLRLPLREVLGWAAAPFARMAIFTPTPALPPQGGGSQPSPLRGEGGASAPDGGETTPLAEELLAFFADRLKVMLKDQGIRHDVITAIFEQGGEDDFVRLVARARALQDFLGTEDGANLLALYKRARNIVAKEEKKEGRKYNDAPQESLLKQDEEKALYEALSTCREVMKPAVNEERYEDVMKALAALRAPVDTFFDEVTVNDEDRALRINRLSLLSDLCLSCDLVASFEKIEG
ncbi:MAG: glycine--tRNA ligase subunit beta, partial [Rickettsiales bacterium]|nr:glycine--tRNA ligase subunit beta [Rickettsiales bacterium]